MFEHKIAVERQEKLPMQRDRRADEGQRQVRVDRDGILISRRFSGISMHIAVPVSAYRGVALDVRAVESGGAAYRLSLAHRDPDLDVLLTETRDSGAVAADWKYWASFLDLPRLAAKDGNLDGELEILDPQIGAVAAKGALARRRNVSVLKRRPRFLTRRKRGDAARMEAVFAGEREIVCYE